MDIYLTTARKTECPSENLPQKLGFLHHFWVSRKSGNPVISSPAPDYCNQVLRHISPQMLSVIRLHKTFPSKSCLESVLTWGYAEPIFDSDSIQNQAQICKFNPQSEQKNASQSLNL